MTALLEKVTLRRLLQAYVHRLDEAILDQMECEAKPERTLTFHKDSVIDWHNGKSVFSPQTYRLLLELYKAKSRTVSKEDVRQDVLYNDDADNAALRQCIAKARKEIQQNAVPVKIETIVGKGYKLLLNDAN